MVARWKLLLISKTSRVQISFSRVFEMISKSNVFLGEELYKYLCFRSNHMNYLYLSMYMYVVLKYEINMFKLNVFTHVLFSDVAPYLDHLRGASSTEEKDKALCRILEVFLDPKNGKN